MTITPELIGLLLTGLFGLLGVVAWFWKQNQILHGRITTNSERHSKDMADLQDEMNTRFVRKDDFNTSMTDMKSDMRHMNQTLTEFTTAMTFRFDQLMQMMTGKNWGEK